MNRIETISLTFQNSATEYLIHGQQTGEGAF